MSISDEARDILRDVPAMTEGKSSVFNHEVKNMVGEKAGKDQSLPSQPKDTRASKDQGGGRALDEFTPNSQQLLKYGVYTGVYAEGQLPSETIPGGPHLRVKQELEEGGYLPWVAERIAPGIRGAPVTHTSDPGPEVDAGEGLTRQKSGLMSSRPVVAGGMVGATVVIHPSPFEEI